jgi:hypothetical protein
MDKLEPRGDLAESDGKNPAFCAHCGIPFAPYTAAKFISTVCRGCRIELNLGFPPDTAAPAGEKF